MDNTNPLVTVRVSSYNSSKTITQTLDSIYNQTYLDIELIISDDCSTDNTVLICNDWLNKYSNRFIKTQLIESATNTGIPSNINRAINKSTGKWIKGIAADDILVPECIDICVEYIKQNPEALFIGGNVLKFTDNNKPESESVRMIDRRNLLNNLPSASSQWDRLLYRNFLAAPTFFVSRHVYDVFLYDESLKLLEDYPFILAILKQGIRYHHIDKVLALYRISNNSVYHNALNTKLFNDFYKTLRDFDKRYRYKHFNPIFKLSNSYDFYLKKICDTPILNNKNSPLLFIYLGLSHCNIFKKISKIFYPSFFK